MIGVLGDGRVAELARAAVVDADLAVVSGDVDEVLAADPALVVAVGEESVVALAGADAALPVLPVAAGGGLRSVSPDDVEPALQRAVAGEWTAETRPVLAAEADGRAWTVLLDALLVTTEPVRISEFSVETTIPTEAGSDGAVPTDPATVGRFRADGVVVATPAGSLGYARAAGGPVLDPTADSVVAVPIAPFTTDRSSWVLDLPVALTVERGETDVSIVVDGRDRGTVPAGASVTIRPGGTLVLATVPESAPFFEQPSP